MRISNRLSDRGKWPRKWWYPDPVVRVGKYTPEVLQGLHKGASETLRRTMLVLLGLSLFCLLATLSAPDAAFLGVGAALTLPQANIPLSFVGFLWAAPLLLIVIAAYLHVFLGYWLELEAARRTLGQGIERLPALFNMDQPLARITSAVIFYALVPVVFLLMATRCWSQQAWFYGLYALSGASALSYCFLAIRRCTEEELEKRGRLWHGMVVILLFYLTEISILGPLIPPLNLYAANLSGRVLDHQRMADADLRYSDLSKASLNETDSQGAMFWGANLEAVRLRHADLKRAVFWSANLKEVDLWGADLKEAILIEVEGLQCSQLKQAENWDAAFRDDILDCGKRIPPFDPIAFADYDGNQRDYLLPDELWCRVHPEKRPRWVRRVHCPEEEGEPQGSEPNSGGTRK